jgi:hypothetical protein
VLGQVRKGTMLDVEEACAGCERGEQGHDWSLLQSMPPTSVRSLRSWWSGRAGGDHPRARMSTGRGSLQEGSKSGGGQSGEAQQAEQVVAAERRAADGAQCVRPGPFLRGSCTRAAKRSRGGDAAVLRQMLWPRGLGPRKPDRRRRRRPSTGVPQVGAGSSGQLRRRRGGRRSRQDGIAAAGADVRVTGPGALATAEFSGGGGGRATSPPPDKQIHLCLAGARARRKPVTQRGAEGVSQPRVSPAPHGWGGVEFHISG